MTPEPMSLRRAYQIAQWGPPDERSFDSDEDFAKACDERERAVAIVDAAVEAHEALDRSLNMAHPDFTAKVRAGIEWFDAYDKLRRMERGENIK